MPQPSIPDHQPVPKWLRKLQTESWQAEILLSGLVIYALLQGPEAVERLHYWIEGSWFYSGDEKNVAAFAELAIYWLTGGFILHLVLRGVWASYVGLSYLYPEGIRDETNQFAPAFAHYLKDLPSPKRRVIQLERICSGLFGVSFYLFMSLAGLTLFYLLLNYVLFHAQVYVGNLYEMLSFRYFVFTMLALNLLYLLDFLSLGKMKKIRWVAFWYYPIYRLVSWLFLAPLYRDVYYLFLSHVRRRYILAGLLAYTLISFFAFISIEQGYFHHISHNQYFFPTYMRNNEQLFVSSAYQEYGETPATRASLQSELIRENVLRVQISPSVRSNYNAWKYCTRQLAEPEEGLPCLDKFYGLVLDQDTLPSVSWNYHYREATKDKALLTYLPLHDLTEGKHVLKVVVPNGLYATLPFFYYPERP